MLLGKIFLTISSIVDQYLNFANGYAWSDTPKAQWATNLYQEEEE